MGPQETKRVGLGAKLYLLVNHPVPLHFCSNKIFPPSAVLAGGGAEKHVLWNLARCNWPSFSFVCLTSRNIEQHLPYGSGLPYLRPRGSPAVCNFDGFLLDPLPFRPYGGAQDPKKVDV